MARWVRIDVDYLSNPKLLRAGTSATLLHLASVLYLGQHDIDDGVLPAQALPVVGAMARVRNVRRVGQALITQGLWVALDEGVLVHDYDELNGELSEAARARDRKRRERERTRLRLLGHGDV